jgi:hypothetical protein
MKRTKRQLLSGDEQPPVLLINCQDQGKRLHLAIRMRPALMAGRRMEKRLTVLTISSSIRTGRLQPLSRLHHFSVAASALVLGQRRGS